MEAAILLLAVVLFIELTLISSKLNEIAKNLPDTPNLDDIEEKLETISIALGGEEKKKEMTKKKKAELKRRYIKLAINIGKKTPKQARDEAEKIFEEAEFEETHDGLPQFDRIEDWVKRTEIEEHNRAKYGKFLDKARDYIKQKDKIFPHGRDRQDMADSIETDYEGAGWLIEQLVKEKKLEEIKEYSDDGTERVVKWKVVKG